jgi:hypothetical protein
VSESDELTREYARLAIHELPFSSSLFAEIELALSALARMADPSAALATPTLLTAADLDQWYTQRVIDIDERSGQLNLAHALGTHALQVSTADTTASATTASPFPKLIELLRLVDELDKLVYEYNLPIRLSHWRTQSSLTRLATVLELSTADTIAQDMTTMAADLLFVPADMYVAVVVVVAVGVVDPVAMGARACV